MTDCFHCGLPIPADEHHTVTIDGERRPVCCAGCAAVAQLIAGSGLDAFYRHRTASAPRPDVAAPDAMRWAWLDRDSARRRWLTEARDGRVSATLAIGELRCSACAWLIEHGLGDLAAVDSVQVNPANGRAQVVWDVTAMPFGELMAQIEALGYRPAPADSGDAQAEFVAERRGHLKRLALAGLGMMQVMMYAAALYAGAFQGMAAEFRHYFWWVSLLVATPVVFYSGAPFFRAAWRGLRAGRPGMDLPVSLAVGGAWAASTWATFTGSGEVWFDSATMFVFFLTLGRFLEFSARRRSGEALARLAGARPETARRLGSTGEETVPAEELETGDRIRLVAGERIPADARLLDGRLSVDESLLTGESEPVTHGPGDSVTGGSLCVNGSAEARVLRPLAEGTLSGIRRLMARAQLERPPLARLADRIASWFVIVVLVVASVAGAAWWWMAPAEAPRVVLSILVVTCPCALSLATPAALAAATGRLARDGLLITGAGALETLAGLNAVVFDKTGTLTLGHPVITEIRTFGDLAEPRALGLAAALEAHSSHPLARAFSGSQPAGSVTEFRNEAGAGIEGRINGRLYRLGQAGFAAAAAATSLPAVESWLVLGDGRRMLAAFQVRDSLRPEAAATVSSLRAAGLDPQLVSGDAAGAVARVAGAAGIAEWHARQSPDDKLMRLRRLQAEGCRVAAVGDGVNDGPLLAGADVGIAMGGGAALTQQHADAVLMGHRLGALAQGIATARQARRIIHQNLAWAVFYNAIALPLAMAGLLAPWMAAVGMSASSLVVVGNALRLQRQHHGTCLSADDERWLERTVTP
ncbi:MAG: heavy metal translocating P-type ATPase [Gammaproteobacteria bacterium]